MADVTQLHPSRDSRGLEERRARRREQFLSQEPQAPNCRGFSSRLNMLCGLAGERDLGAGRLEDIADLNPAWNVDDVRQWLCEDQLPPRGDLSALVSFLVANTEKPQPTSHWEAYLVFGGELVPNPLRSMMSTSSNAYLTLAAKTLTAITDEYELRASDYDAEQKLRETVELLSRLHIDSRIDSLQPGHRLMIAASLFPDRVRG